MKDPATALGPVIIGGVGGSGTRVVAEILRLFGYYFGNDLNTASDNLSYTLLFKRPEWFRKHYPESRQFYTGLKILEKVILTGQSFTFSERMYMRKAAGQMAKYGHNSEGQGKGEWAYQRLDLIKEANGLDKAKYLGWGWKEPNSHLMLPVFPKYFSRFQYIHTVRHGLDMAFSKNQQQLFNWGSLFNIEMPERPEDIPYASFRFWVEANKRAVVAGKLMGAKKFLLVNFDDLCENPVAGIKEIVDFLKIDPGREKIEKALQLPVKPDTLGRFKDHPDMRYDPMDISFLEQLGFRY